MRKTKVIGIMIILFGVFCFLASGIFNNVRSRAIQKIEDEVYNLGELIDVDGDYAGRYAKIDADKDIFLFAQKNGGGSKGYYFAVDEKYNYIIYITEAQAKQIEEKGGMEIRGITRDFTNELRNSAIDWMAQNNSESEITKENFRLYFGAVYLDATANLTELTTDMNAAVRISFVIGVFLIIVGMMMAGKGKW